MDECTCHDRDCIGKDVIINNGIIYCRRCNKKMPHQEFNLEKFKEALETFKHKKGETNG